MQWMSVRGNTPGPLFLADKSGSLKAGKALSYDSFKYRFEDELRKIGIWSWNLYGTHSFRRGGCQFYLSIRRKTLGEICAWGGWSDLSVAFRYMIGSNDDVKANRQEFTRPPNTKICRSCRLRLLE